MKITELLRGERFAVLDGGMGTMLQRLGLAPGQRPELLAATDPELLVRVHEKYVAAGANVVYANTFGASPRKLEGSGYEPEDIIPAALDAARRAAKPAEALVALDIGPLGELLAPAGTLGFEEAVAQFARMVKAGRDKADLVVIETMTDLQETRAALLAAKESCDLPVLVSMSFEENGRTFTGCSVEAFAACIGGMGADGLGINCSLGPVQIFPLAQRLCAVAPEGVMVFVKPNAGLPDPATGAYGLDAGTFLAGMLPYAEIGVSAVGGCCGTTPGHIRALAEHFAPLAPAKRSVRRQSLVCSATAVVRPGEGPVAVGERINPTGKKKFQQALRAGDMDYLLAQAVAQADAGADMLDVNVGLPDIDEAAMMERTVLAVQAVAEQPLQLDSTNPAALEKGLRVYCGKALVNSVNGERKVLDAILPLCKKYGAAVIGLTLDENGIPTRAEERVKIAERIVAEAAKYGIPACDVYIDCLTLTASAQQKEVMETLKALAECKRRLGVRTVLGVSNISFGLPCREYLNTAFLTMALQAGLDLAIINPNAESMMAALAAFKVLSNTDERAQGYIARYAGTAPVSAAAKAGMGLADAVEKGLKAEAAAAARAELAQKEPMRVVNELLIPALDEVGAKFEKGTLFLPQLLQAAAAAQAAFEEVKKALERSGEESAERGKIVIATVKGDIHDIGKNIVKVILQNYGFSVLDLGRDVAPERVVQAVKETGAPLVGLSALMTTTLPAMRETIALLRAEAPGCRVMVGGAVLTERYAAEMGADFYAKDAKQSADIAKLVFARA